MKKLYIITSWMVTLIRIDVPWEDYPVSNHTHSNNSLNLFPQAHQPGLILDDQKELLDAQKQLKLKIEKQKDKADLVQLVQHRLSPPRDGQPEGIQSVRPKLRRNPDMSLPNGAVAAPQDEVVIDDLDPTANGQRYRAQVNQEAISQGLDEKTSQLLGFVAGEAQRIRLEDRQLISHKFNELEGAITSHQIEADAAKVVQATLNQQIGLLNRGGPQVTGVRGFGGSGGASTPPEDWIARGKRFQSLGRQQDLGGAMTKARLHDYEHWANNALTRIELFLGNAHADRGLANFWVYSMLDGELQKQMGSDHPLKHKSTSPDEYMKILKTAFTPANHQALNRSAFNSCRQNQNGQSESPQQYFNRLNVFYKKLEFNDFSIFKDRFIGGLVSESLKKTVILKLDLGVVTTPQALLEVCLDAQSILLEQARLCKGSKQDLSGLEQLADAAMDYQKSYLNNRHARLGEPMDLTSLNEVLNQEDDWRYQDEYEEEKEVWEIQESEEDRYYWEDIEEEANFYLASLREGGTGKKVCWHCQEEGHFRDNCPSRYEETNSAMSRGRSSWRPRGRGRSLRPPHTTRPFRGGAPGSRGTGSGRWAGRSRAPFRGAPRGGRGAYPRRSLNHVVEIPDATEVLQDFRQGPLTQ